jgi:hypothetical protein
LSVSDGEYWDAFELTKPFVSPVSIRVGRCVSLLTDIDSKHRRFKTARHAGREQA